MNRFVSKKFVAWLISLAVLTLILIIALTTQTFNMAMTFFMSIGIATIAGLTLGYVLSQRKLDTVQALMSNVLNNTPTDVKVIETNKKDNDE